MPIHFYNTLTKKLEEFQPLVHNKISMYMCGPTVYDYFHIGNARSFVMADIINRYFRYKGFEVKFVMNLTDIDDKIINKAIEEKTDTKTISGKYTRAFFEDIEKL
ncbi:MAG: class I tRNA ligase family protein, partial [Bacteroidetes bacterium]|nr:class I tRNA ligase family protein [Bacteroidota bacterium]